MTESDDHLFCLITMNHHPLHLNDVYASESQQGQNVVVGPLVYSLALGMSVSDVSGKAIANLATEELSHPNPVFHGDTLYCESEVLEVRAVEVEARPRDRQGPHPRLQAGQHAGRGVQAHRADPEAAERRHAEGRGRRRVGSRRWRPATQKLGAGAEPIESVEWLRGFGERYLRAWNAHDPDAVCACATADVVWVDPALPEPARGHAGLAAFVRDSCTAFPDISFPSSASRRSPPTASSPTRRGG